MAEKRAWKTIRSRMAHAMRSHLFVANEHANLKLLIRFDSILFWFIAGCYMIFYAFIRQRRRQGFCKQAHFQFIFSMSKRQTKFCFSNRAALFGVTTSQINVNALGSWLHCCGNYILKFSCVHWTLFSETLWYMLR